MDAAIDEIRMKNVEVTDTILVTYMIDDMNVDGDRGLEIINGTEIGIGKGKGNVGGDGKATILINIMVGGDLILAKLDATMMATLKITAAVAAPIRTTARGPRNMTLTLEILGANDSTIQRVGCALFVY